MEIISSFQNSKAKLIKSLLSDKKYREKHRLFVAEGYNIVRDMPSGAAGHLYIRESDLDRYLAVATEKNLPYTVFSDGVFDSVSDTVNSNGILAALPFKEEKPLSGGIVLVLDGISDAGNMGTIIRTAAAMGVYDIIAAECVDFYNPKAVRATMGGIYHVNILAAVRSAAAEMIKGYTAVALDMSGRDIFSYRPPKKLALIVGSEARGVSEELKSVASETLSVPMPGGKIESLNAAVSISIALAVLTHG